MTKKMTKIKMKQMIKKIILPAVTALVLTAFAWVAFAAPGAWTAPDQEQAKKRAKQVVPFIKEYKDEGPLERKISLMDAGISLNDINEVYFLLDSPIIKKSEDHYEPVRFAHKRHAALTQDCFQCHHLKPKDETALETTRCSACHQESFNSDHPERIGLKAAYHQQCMECHRTEAKGPVDCKGCQGTVSLYKGPSKGDHARQGHNGPQQLLNQPHQQRGSLHKLPCRIRMERRFF